MPTVRREQQRLHERIQMLENELTEYEEKERRNKQLNEFIMNLKQNESAIEQFNQREAERITSRHSEELKRARAKH